MIKRKVERGSTFYAYVRPFMQCLYFICQRKFYPRTHVKITRQWKSTLRLATCIVKLVIIKDYWSALVSSLKISKPFLSKRNFQWTLQFSQVQITAVFVLLWRSSSPVKWTTCKRTQQLPTLLTVGNCGVRVGSGGVQTDATTPDSVETYSALSWEGYNP